MALAKIKEQYGATVVAFGNSGLPLGQRDDIDDLAIMAQRSQDPTLIQLFEELPPLDELLKNKAEAALPARKKR